MENGKCRTWKIIASWVRKNQTPNTKHRHDADPCTVPRRHPCTCFPQNETIVYAQR